VTWLIHVWHTAHRRYHHPSPRGVYTPSDLWPNCHLGDVTRSRTSADLPPPGQGDKFCAPSWKSVDFRP